jgi:hypothetical protein
MKTVNFTSSELEELKTFYKHQLSQVQHRLSDIQGILEKIDPKEMNHVAEVKAEVIKVAEPVKAVAAPVEKVAVVETPKKAEVVKAEPKPEPKKAEPVKPVVAAKPVTKAASSKPAVTAKPKAKTPAKKVAAKKAPVKIAKKAVVKVVAKAPVKATTPAKSSGAKPTNLDYSNFIFKSLNNHKRPMQAAAVVDDAMKYFKMGVNDRPEVRLSVARMLSYFEKANNAKLGFYLPKGQSKGGYYGLPEWFSGKNKLKPNFEKLVK